MMILDGTMMKSKECYITCAIFNVILKIRLLPNKNVHIDYSVNKGNRTC